jgi:hypothetical protein
VLTKVGETLLKNGVITPAEFRPVAELMLNIDLTAQAGDWQRLPMGLIMAGHTPPQIGKPTSTAEAIGDGKPDASDAAPMFEPAASGVSPRSEEAIAKAILRLRGQLDSMRYSRLMAEAASLDSETPPDAGEE